MNHKLKRILLFISLIVSAISFVQNVNLGYGAIFLLPLTFGILVQIIPSNSSFQSGLTMMILVLSLRYLLYPMLFKNHTIDAHIEKYFIPAVTIMLFEIIAIVLTIKIYYIRHRPAYNCRGVILDKMNGLIPMVFFLLMIGIYLTNPGVYANRHFILNSENINIETEKISGILSQPMMWGEILLTTFCFTYCCIRYARTKKESYYWASVFVVFFRCLFFTGHSRLSLLIPFVITIFLLKKAYDKKANWTISFVVIYGVISLIILSIYKFFHIENVKEVAITLTPEGNAGLINAYFGGVKNVMVGLQAYAENGSSIMVWINDTFRNAMGISALFEENPQNSVAIFNLATYQYLPYQGFDQICPTVIEGLLMFGIFAFFLPTIIMVYMCCYFDDMFCKTKSIARAYVYAYMATLIGWAIPGNYMHLCGLVFNFYIPLILLISFNEVVKRRH